VTFNSMDFMTCVSVWWPEISLDISDAYNKICINNKTPHNYTSSVFSFKACFMRASSFWYESVCDITFGI
jgi:hypothetical protein